MTDHDFLVACTAAVISGSLYTFLVSSRNLYKKVQDIYKAHEIEVENANAQKANELENIIHNTSPEQRSTVINAINIATRGVYIPPRINEVLERYSTT